MLVALGADYNIFLMGRIKEEYDRTGDVGAAVRQGVEHTGRVITSAGLILAGTFGVLVFAPMPNLRQIGFAISFGIILDTFIVRTLLVPSATVLLGERVWWPRKRKPTEPQPESTSSTPHDGNGRRPASSNGSKATATAKRRVSAKKPSRAKKAVGEKGKPKATATRKPQKRRS
jgi:RND superfamily putative drug exporter